jgi:hypothetical protein
MFQKVIFFVFLLNTFFAQKAPFEEIVIGLWPEYDHPGVLVTIQIDILESELPYDIEITLPPGSRMALKKGLDENGEETMVQQDIIVVNDKTIMPIQLTQSHFYSQFYFNPFNESDHRELKYEFSTNKLLDHYHVLIQKHLIGENFRTNLTDPEEFQNEYDIHFFRQHLDSLEPNENFTIELSYDNPSHRTTVDILKENFEQQDNTTNSESPSAQKNDNLVLQNQNVKKYTFLLFAVFGVVLIFIIWKFGKKGDKNIPQESKIAKEEQFCKNCGSSILKDNKFCTSCGEEINVS